MEQEKKSYDESQAHVHVHNHAMIVHGLKKHLSQCIDGRYLPEDNEAVSIPGADAGELQVMMVALKQLLGRKELHVDDVKILEDVLVDIVRDVKNLRFHNDDHHHKEGGIGCGHLRLGNEFPEEYTLSESEMKMVNDFVEKSIVQGAKNIILIGGHGEKAVFIVDSPTHTICSQDKDGNQVFIYHKTFAEKRNTLIAKSMKQMIPELAGNHKITKVMIASALNTIMEDHLAKTSGKLAKGLPIYKVVLGKQDKNLQYLGKVE